MALPQICKIIISIGYRKLTEMAMQNSILTSSDSNFAEPDAGVSTSESRLRVRYAETDQMGVVYYANYLVWFEVGRVELLRQLGFDYKRMEIEDDCWIPVVEATCRYKSPARYDDELIIWTEIASMRTSVLKFRYRIARATDQCLLAEGETTHVITDSAMQKRPLPGKYAECLLRFMNAGKTGSPEKD
jgi:acyl-CoA thioester hydrolase